jgi:hypothetical protein
MNISDISASQLRRAASIKEQMEKLHKELTRILGMATPAATAPDGRKKKRTMSTAARALISAAQKKRWAKKQSATVVQKPKAKSKMSPAAKAKLSAKMKEIWAKRKAAKK